jgi:mannose-6-phosphate isomerase-like protein (cupin superfamily)
MEKRRDLLTLAGIGAFAAFAGSARGAGKLPNGTMNGSQAKLIKEHFGDVRVYYDGSTDQLRAMTAGSAVVNPGMAHDPHQHEEEEFMVITEGTAEISVDGKVTKVGPGSMMYCAGGKMHGIRNMGNRPVLFYFYKWKA